MYSLVKGGKDQTVIKRGTVSGIIKNPEEKL